MTLSSSRLRVCAVSYLNTTPLVWGMLHGPQQGLFELLFRVPSQCADMVSSGDADIGIIPSFELLRQKLAVVPGVGIACCGAVRSILLVSKCPAGEIRTLAADSSSRTSVALARIILERKFGRMARIVSQPPALEAMLRDADAALIIGDPALRLDPQALDGHVYDLGEEWTAMTGLPMVFAVWAGRQEVIDPAVIAAFQKSSRYGRERLDEIVRVESAARGFSPSLVRAYLGDHIRTEVGEPERRGMELFLQLARELAGAAPDLPPPRLPITSRSKI